MATLGKPNIDTPRSLELRVVAQAIGNIRQRIEAIEAQTSTVAAQAGETTLRSGQQNISITALRTQLAALAARVDALAVVDAELETFRAGSAITANTAVYPSGDGLVSQVDPGDPLKVYAVLGVATQTAVEGANVVVRKAGVMQIADAVFEPGGPVYVGISGLTQHPDYINLAIPVGVAVSADEIDVRPGWPALQYPGVYSEYETFLPATWGLVRDAVTLADDFNSAANGIAVRTGEDDVTTRTLTGTPNRVAVTNGSGVSGDPTIDISSSYVGQTSITTVGTIGTGAWQGTVVAPAFGGTGVANNAASTITISGAFASTFTMTGVTAVTFPTSGTLATTAQLPVGASPSTSVGLTAVNGAAPTFMRSDAAPALDVGISPTWTANHRWTDNDEVQLGTGGDLRVYHDGTDSRIRNDTGNLILSVGSTAAVTVDSSRRVGIGVTPVGRFDVGDGANARFKLGLSATEAQLSGRNSSDTGSAVIGFYGSAVTFNSDSGEVFRTDTNQRLLIGASATALAKVRIVADADPWLRLESGSAGTTYMEMLQGGSASALGYIGSDGGGAVSGGTGSILAVRGENGIKLAVGNSVKVEVGASTVKLQADNRELQIGASDDLRMYHNGTDSIIENDTGNLILRVGGELSIDEVTTTTTAPAAGGAGALPATPAGYMTLIINGTSRQVAYY